MKIGILFPLSKAHPGVGFDFMDGLNGLLKHKGHTGNVTIIKESVGYGANEKEVCQKAEKLLISDEVDILIAYVDEKVLPVLDPLVQATGRLMLVVNPGANYPVNWIAQPTVVRLNLQHAFCCRLTGALAAQSGNGHAALATSFYDCGYLHSAAMVKCFMDAGGVIRHNYINNQAYDASFEINQLTGFLAANPDCENLLCVFDALPASLFYARLDEYKPDSPLHLFVSPMMLQALYPWSSENTHDYSVEGYMPWHAGLENEANRLLLQTVTRPATMFSLLGWETGLVLDDIMLHSGEATGNGEQIVAQLKQHSISSPRGMLTLDPETQIYTAPLIKFSRKAGESFADTTQVTGLENEWRAFTAEPTEGAVTGWMNTYLCY